MNQRRYVEHNLFLQSSNSKHINQVLLKSYSGLVKVLHNILLKSYSTSHPIPYESSYSSLTQYFTQILLKSNMTPYSGLVKPLPKISHLVILMNLVTHFFIHK